MHLSEHLNVYEESKVHFENVFKLLALSNRIMENKITLKLWSISRNW